jgi:hypothetical protein
MAKRRTKPSETRSSFMPINDAIVVKTASPVRQLAIGKDPATFDDRVTIEIRNWAGLDEGEKRQRFGQTHW